MAARGREQAACRGEESAVSRPQPWALDLTAQDLELMAKHDQLDVLTCAGRPLAISSLSREMKTRQMKERSIARCSQSPPEGGAQAGDLGFGTLQAIFSPM
jgi:hypothetical protein